MKLARTVKQERPNPKAIQSDRGRKVVTPFLSKLGPGLITGSSDDDPS